MNTGRTLYHLALADVYERTRRSGFLLILAAVVYLGVLVNNGTLILEVSDSDLLSPNIRGEFNSAWIGTLTVMSAVTLFLSLFGFYLVKDCIERDTRTGVGQIIATTPVSRAAYLAGKWISNTLVLLGLVLVLAAAAVVMALLKSEAPLDLGALLMPFAVIALPSMALTAALAVVFETAPWLRGALGNTVYFFLWIAIFMGLGMPKASFLKDPVGYHIVRDSLVSGAAAAFPNSGVHGLSIGINPFHNIHYQVFRWSGLDWTPGIVTGQWVWAGIALGLVLLSAAWFARFDPSRESPRGARAKPAKGPARIRLPHLALPGVSPLVSRLAQASPFLGVLLAELRLLLNGRRWWWWAITAGLNIAILACPPDVTLNYLMPAAWLWPMGVWSEMGSRERQRNTAQMVFASARPVRRQLPAAWLAGVLTAALLEVAGAVALILAGDLPGVAGWVGAVIFVPTLALALGVCSSGSRVFQVVYLVWWYVGPMHKVAGMDFTRAAPQLYLLAAAGLLLLSAGWRSRQVRAG